MNRTIIQLPILFAALACTFLASSVVAQDHIAWKYDLDNAKQVASSENKLILLHFSASWCGPCKEIERFVFVNPMAIRAISGQVVPVKVDIDLKEEIAREYNVKSVPYDVIITPAGHVVTERSSPRSTDGYLQMIQNAKSGAENMSTDVARNVRDLKKEMMRQQQQAATENSSADSYGSLAAKDANNFRSSYTAPAGANVPEFQKPQPWPKSETRVPPPATDGVVQNKFALPSSSFVPTTPGVQVPSTQAPKAPTTFANSANQFPNNNFRNQNYGNRSASASSNGQGNLHATASGHSAPFSQANQSSAADVQVVNNHFQPEPDKTTANSLRPNAYQRNTQPVASTSASTNGPATAVAKRVVNPLFAGQKSPANSFRPGSTANEIPTTSGPTSLTVRTSSATSLIPEQPETPDSTQTAIRVEANSASPIAPIAGEKTPEVSTVPALGMEGYCCITLMEHQRWEKGSREWGCIHRGRLFLFASKESRDQFQLSPDSYSPLLGGADPVKYHGEGSLVDGLRKHGVFYGEDDGPTIIVLFESQENRDKFESNPTEYLRTVRQAMSRVDSDRLLR